MSPQYPLARRLEPPIILIIPEHSVLFGVSYTPSRTSNPTPDAKKHGQLLLSLISTNQNIYQITKRCKGE